MKVVIMGCGRVGSTLAAMLSEAGHEVTVLDTRADAFRRLPADFGGRRHVGNGIDQDVLARIGVGEADAFIAVTQGDNRNVMATQMAKHIFGVERTLCRIYDPIREEMYRALGLETISPTIVGANLLKDLLDNPPPPEAAKAPPGSEA
jgi:trk system potassium uptake protein TrkA